jgi:hypothetical protein
LLTTQKRKKVLRFLPAWTINLILLLLDKAQVFNRIPGLFVFLRTQKRVIPNLNLDLDLDLDHNLELDLDHNLELDLDYNLDLDLDHNLTFLSFPELEFFLMSQFGHETLNVYQESIRFITWIN